MQSLVSLLLESRNVMHNCSYAALQASLETKLPPHAGRPVASTFLQPLCGHSNMGLPGRAPSQRERAQRYIYHLLQAIRFHLTAASHWRHTNKVGIVPCAPRTNVTLAGSVMLIPTVDRAAAGLGSLSMQHTFNECENHLFVKRGSKLQVGQKNPPHARKSFTETWDWFHES